MGTSYMVPIKGTENYAPSDPAALSISVRDPLNNVNVYTYAVGTGPIQRLAQGVYQFQIFPGSSGRWFYSVLWSGFTEAMTSSGQFMVLRPSVPG